MYAVAAAGKDRRLMWPVILLFVYLNLIFMPLSIEPRYGVALMPGIISLAGIGLYKVFKILSEFFSGSRPAEGGVHDG